MNLEAFSVLLKDLIGRVPKELVAAVAIILLIIVLISNIMPPLSNSFHITLALIILLILVTGCTLCLVLYASSKADERRYKYVLKNFESYKKYSEKIDQEIEREFDKAATMRAEHE